MKKLCVILSFLTSLICFTSLSWALPPCPKDANKSWNNCYGSYDTGPSKDGGGYKYVGEWKDDKFHGQGTYIFLPESKWAGDKYVGQWIDGQMHGEGTYVYGIESKWAGDKYVGQWKNGKYNGQGTYTSKKTGTKLEGEWKDGKMHGQGKKTYGNGKIEEGIWENDKFMYEKKSTSTSNPKVEEYKSFCLEIGLTPGTEKFGECVVEAMKKG